MTYPPVRPFAQGLLTRDDGARLYYELSGTPDGLPAVYLHGGPGSGLGEDYRTRFDPARYMVVGLDQRGCGRSRPWAVDDLAGLDRNTTDVLVDDVEALREHLGVHRWVVHGVSWGSSLALAYASAHPARVLALVLAAVTTGTRAEVTRLTETMGEVFPEAWHRFAAQARPGERPVDAYARMLRDPDPQVRARASAEWHRWEDTHVSLAPGHVPAAGGRDVRELQNKALLVTHYWSHDCFMPQPGLLERAPSLGPVPVVLVHGRHDISSPVVTAWRLHRALVAGELHVVEDEGHVGPRILALAGAALDRFARGVGPRGVVPGS